MIIWLLECPEPIAQRNPATLSLGCLFLAEGRCLHALQPIRFHGGTQRKRPGLRHTSCSSASTLVQAPFESCAAALESPSLQNLDGQACHRFPRSHFSSWNIPNLRWQRGRGDGSRLQMQCRHLSSEYQNSPGCSVEQTTQENSHPRSPPL